MDRIESLFLYYCICAMGKHRFLSDSYLFHVQVPLALGVLFGTILYAYVFHQWLTEKLIQVAQSERKAAEAQHRLDNGSHRKWKEVVQLQRIGLTEREELPRKKKNGTSVVRATECRRMRKRFKNEFPANVEFPDTLECERWDGFAREVRKCTIEYMNKKKGTNDTWKAMRESTECCAHGLYRMISATALTDGHVTKYVVFPNTPTLPCYAISIGEWKNVSIDRQLKQTIPQCEQHVVMNDKKTGKHFEDIGSVVHYVQLNPYAHAAAEATADNVHQITFDTLLQSYVEASEIDYLFVRSEGEFEHYLLRWLDKQKKKKRDRIPVCFITMDLHKRLRGFRVDEFAQFISTFLRQSDYLLLRAVDVDDDPHKQRIFLINAHEPFCVEKYFGQWCQPASEDE